MPLSAFLTAALPIIGGLANNVLSGINQRSARLYDSPANQVKRLNEAGLPKAAASNLTPGGGVTATSSTGAEQINNQIAQSVSTQVQRKQLAILADEARIKAAEAAEKEGEVKNKLNPTGIFEQTNQGTNAMLAIQKEQEAVKGAQIVNKWMPTEKFQNVLKTGKEIESISANTANALTQNGILLSESKIKSIVADYQERMSLHELTNLIRRNTGISKDNELKQIAINIEYATMLDKIKLAKNAASISDSTKEAAILSNILTHASLPSTRKYYEIRRFVDDIHSKDKNLVKSMIYLGMFQPNTSNYNLSNLSNFIPNIPGTTIKNFSTNNYMK